MLSRTRSRSRGWPDFCGSIPSRCSGSETPGSSIAFTLRPINSDIEERLEREFDCCVLEEDRAEGETDADDSAPALAPSDKIIRMRSGVYRLSRKYPCQSYACGSYGYTSSMGDRIVVLHATASSRP